MLKISSILSYIHSGIKQSMERFVIVDDQHIVDSNTGVELHMYDDWFKVTHNGEMIASHNDFTPEEKAVIGKIKSLITDPELQKERDDNYKEMIASRRKLFSDLYENPKPMVSKHPVEEEDADEYTG